MDRLIGNLRRLGRYNLERLIGHIPGAYEHHLNKALGPDFVRLLPWCRETQWLDRDQIELYQIERLIALLRHAQRHVPYYRALFRRQGTDVKSIKSMTDLEKIPILSKETVQSSRNNLEADNSAIYHPKLNYTGGSTGKPLQFLLDAETVALGQALHRRCWEWARYRAGDPCMVIKSALGAHVGNPDYNTPYLYAPIIRTITINAGRLNASLINQAACFLKKYSIKVIQGYPSTLYVFSKQLLQRNIDRLSVKCVLTNSEKIYPFQRNLIEHTIGARVFDWYGMWEHVGSAAQCQYGNYHVNFEIGILEVVDEQGRNCIPGQIGRIVGTCLTNYAMPFIRYFTGDFGYYEQKACPCGRTLPIINIVGGREKDLLSTPKGYISVIPEAWVFGVAVKEIQFYQKKPDHIVLRVVKDSNYSEVDTHTLCRRLDRTFGTEITATLEFVEAIPRTREGKFKFVDSKVQDVFEERGCS